MPNYNQRNSRRAMRQLRNTINKAIAIKLIISANVILTRGTIQKLAMARLLESTSTTVCIAHERVPVVAICGGCDVCRA